VRTTSLRLFVPLFLAVSFVAVSTSASALPVAVSAREGVSAVGLYRLTMSAKDRHAKTIHLLVRDDANGISAMLIDGESECLLTNVHMEGSVLKGNLLTNEGLAGLSLNVSDDMITGTLTVKGKQLVIEGDRNN
jgi:hypothetical protein